MRVWRLAGVVAVLIIGLCAAWPFRQPRSQTSSGPSTAPPRAAAPLQLPLRRSDTPQDLAPQSDVSPAVDLAEVARTSAAAALPPAPPASPAIEWASLTPPPALPASFQPGLAPPPKMEWQPSRWPEPTALHTARPRAKPRTYRLRDGDTLERLAERFLASAERAAEIFEMNRAVLARPDLLPVGATILLPPRSEVDDLEPVSGGHSDPARASASP